MLVTEKIKTRSDMLLTNKLIDNSCDELSMVNTLKECIELQEIETIRIATGYWDIPGLALITDELRKFLERDNKTKIYLLIGKDPYIYYNQLKEPKYKSAKYPEDFIRTEINEIELKPDFKPAIKLLLDYCNDNENSKIQIRIFRKNENDETQFLHSKCYIFTGNGKGLGLIGSSNFTKQGLIGNAELNYLETNPLLVEKVKILDAPGSIYLKTHTLWFNEKWDLSEPWNKTFLEQILKPSPIGKETKKEIDTFTPYELYIKLLQIKFGDIIDKNLSQQISTWLPKDIKCLDYQIDAVKRCVSIMHEHGGFMLADVVGLGKTIVGTLIIKHFLTMQEDDRRNRKVLIVTPPAIKSGWKKTIDQFDEDNEEKILRNITIITTGSIGNLTDENDEEYVTDDMDIDDTDRSVFTSQLKQENYGLIIIDESHKFRNSETQMYHALDSLIEKIWRNKGVYPYVGLLSATPQNNRPNDLKNQIYLFERNYTNSTLKKAESGNLEKFFANANTEYNLLIKKDSSISEEERKERLEKLSAQIRDCILSDILERRTRTDVEKYYSKDMETQGLIFPKIKGPYSLEYKMDNELATLFSDTMKIIAPNDEDRLQGDEYLHYYRYRAIENLVKDNDKKKYSGRGNRNVENVSNQLANIMQILLVKRLESSFTAFKQSLLNLKRYTKNMILMWENDTIFICPQINVNEELDTQKKSKSFGACVDDIRKKIKKLNNEQNAEFQCSDFKPEYYENLKNDYRIIEQLCDRWGNNSEDPKLDTFKENLKPVLFNPETNPSQKLVIFTEAVDTVNALKRAVEAKNLRVLTVTAANRDEREQTIIENFDANYTGTKKDDYNVLITTDVLSEGVNLHRANVVLNYDTPWNSTRLMQRIGRVNRIGSSAKCIYVYNFLPSAQGDEQIELVRKAHTKIQSFHILFGEDSKIFTDDEIVVHHEITKTVDDEESPMQKYIFELRQYRDNHPQRYTQIESKNDDWQIASTRKGIAYFLIHSDKCGRLAVKITDDDGTVISDISMLENLRVAENAIAVPLPDNWQDICNRAELCYKQYFVNLNGSRANDLKTKARRVIVKLFAQPKISEETKNLLRQAQIIVNGGNIDIIRTMLKIGDELHTDMPQLFKIAPEDIDETIKREINHLITKTDEQQGKTSILIATVR